MSDHPLYRGSRFVPRALARVGAGSSCYRPGARPASIAFKRALAALPMVHGESVNARWRAVASVNLRAVAG